MEWATLTGRFHVSWPRHAYQNGNWTVVNANGQPYADILQKNRSGLDGSKWRADRQLWWWRNVREQWTNACSGDPSRCRSAFSAQFMPCFFNFRAEKQLSRREAATCRPPPTCAICLGGLIGAL